jgi:signal transduction histidine kinase
MSIRKLFVTAVLVFSVFGLLVSGLVILTSKWMEQATEQAATATQGVLAAQEIEIQLLRYNQERMLYALTQEETHLIARDDAETKLTKWLAIAYQYAIEPDEQAMLRKAERLIAEFKAIPLPRLTSTQSDVAIYQEALKSMRPVLDALTEILDLNLDQAKQAESDAKRLSSRSDMFGYSAIGLTVLLLVAWIFLTRNTIYKPSLRLRDSIVRAGTDLAARAPETGPAEIREIARVFNEMADERSRQRERQLTFLAAVAHDLRNPLSALKMAAATAGRSASSLTPEKLRDYCDLIQRQVNRMDRQVSDLLDVSMIHAGRVKLKVQRCDVRGLLDEVASLFQSSSERHLLLINAPDDPLQAECDPLRISQVLNNLVSNAIKYSPDGGRVEVTARSAPGGVVISVSDEGVGMSADDLKQIFRPFQRVGAAKEFIPGIGLGLSVSRRLVEAHGGRIEVDSVLGRGTTFRVFVPCVSEQIAVDTR